MIILCVQYTCISCISSIRKVIYVPSRSVWNRWMHLRATDGVYIWTSYLQSAHVVFSPAGCDCARKLVLLSFSVFRGFRFDRGRCSINQSMDRLKNRPVYRPRWPVLLNRKDSKIQQNKCRKLRKTGHKTDVKSGRSFLVPLSGYRRSPPKFSNKPLKIVWKPCKMRSLTPNHHTDTVSTSSSAIAERPRCRVG